MMARFHKKSAPQFIYGIIGGGVVALLALSESRTPDQT